MSLVTNLISSNQYAQFTVDEQDDNKQEDYSEFPLTPTDGKRRDENGHEIMDFYTDYGLQRIAIDGDLSNGRPVIMTYHDIGINHNGCFLSFFNMIKAYDPKFELFNVVHIDAPQHHYHSNELPAQQKPQTAEQLNEVDHFDLEHLASQVDEIRSKLKIEKFIGFGVGAGCSVLTHYGMNYQSRLRGLILLNGVSTGPSWREYFFDNLLSVLGKNSSYIMDSLHSSLLTRYFPKAMPSETYDYFLDQFEKMDNSSVVKYFRGFVSRSELTAQDLKKIKAKTLVLCGEFSRIKDETITLQKNLPRQTTEFVLMRDVGFLLTESSPQKLCSSIDLFVQSMGLTTVSMQRKYGSGKTTKNNDKA